MSSTAPDPSIELFRREQAARLSGGFWEEHDRRLAPPARQHGRRRGGTPAGCALAFLVGVVLALIVLRGAFWLASGAPDRRPAAEAPPEAALLWGEDETARVAP